MGTPGDAASKLLKDNGANYDSIVVNSRRDVTMQDGITLIDSPHVTQDVNKTLPLSNSHDPASFLHNDDSHNYLHKRHVYEGSSTLAAAAAKVHSHSIHVS